MFALNFPSLFKHGKIVYETLIADKTLRPPKNEVWIILGGMVRHITGTSTSLQISPHGKHTHAVFRFFKDTGDASAFLDLFNTEASVNNPQWRPTFITHDFEIVFTGETDVAYVDLQILKW